MTGDSFTSKQDKEFYRREGDLSGKATVGQHRQEEWRKRTTQKIKRRLQEKNSRVQGGKLQASATCFPELSAAHTTLALSTLHDPSPHAPLTHFRFGNL